MPTRDTPTLLWRMAMRDTVVAQFTWIVGRLQGNHKGCPYQSSGLNHLKRNATKGAPACGEWSRLAAEGAV